MIHIIKEYQRYKRKDKSVVHVLILYRNREHDNQTTTTTTPPTTLRLHAAKTGATTTTSPRRRVEASHHTCIASPLRAQRHPANSKRHDKLLPFTQPPTPSTLDRYSQHGSQRLPKSRHPRPRHSHQNPHAPQPRRHNRAAPPSRSLRPRPIAAPRHPRTRTCRLRHCDYHGRAGGDRQGGLGCACATEVATSARSLIRRERIANRKQGDTERWPRCQQRKVQEWQQGQQQQQQQQQQSIQHRRTQRRSEGASQPHHAYAENTHHRSASSGYTQPVAGFRYYHYQRSKNNTAAPCRNQSTQTPPLPPLPLNVQLTKTTTTDSPPSPPHTQPNPPHAGTGTPPDEQTTHDLRHCNFGT